MTKELRWSLRRMACEFQWKLNRDEWHSPQSTEMKMSRLMWFGWACDLFNDMAEEVEYKSDEQQIVFSDIDPVKFFHLFGADYCLRRMTDGSLYFMEDMEISYSYETNKLCVEYMVNHCTNGAVSESRPTV